MNLVKKMTFNEFCHLCCDNLYDPKFSDQDQSTGYKELKAMVLNKIKPASKKEIERWEKTPTLNELLSTPPPKYLRFLHPILRPYVIDNWDTISDLYVEKPAKDLEISK